MDIPNRDVPVLALAHDIVLFPSLVVSIHLASPHATALLSHLDNAAGTVIACVPRKALNSLQNALADAANRSAGSPGDEKLAQVIRIPSREASNEAVEDAANGKLDPANLFECKIGST